jgi:poly-beta-hydroxyalkanoate depolymerase
VLANRLDLCTNDLAEHSFKTRYVACAEAQQVQVARRTVRNSIPSGEKHRTFYDELIAVGALTEAVEQTLEAVARQSHLKIFAAGARSIKQALAH